MAWTSDKIMKLGRPTQLVVKPIKAKREFQFLLSFDGRTPSIEFVTTFDGAMRIMVGLQRLQARQKIPIPQQVRTFGKPKLSIVKLDE
jgi:hypothetical protein